MGGWFDDCDVDFVLRICIWIHGVILLPYNVVCTLVHHCDSDCGIYVDDCELCPCRRLLSMYSLCVCMVVVSSALSWDASAC